MQIHNLPGGSGGGGSTSVTQIYRSIGTNTGVLACGGSDGSGCANNSGNLTINGTGSSATATFASAAPTNIGVGDAIVYDCNGDTTLDAGDCVAFITKRISSTQYGVQDHLGNTPTAYAASGVWRVYRAYTSISNALDQTSGGVENASISAIAPSLGSFDTIAGGANIVTANQQWNFAVYASDGVETNSSSCIGGWTTDASHYVRVYAPYLATEVGMSERAAGVWNASLLAIDDSGTLDDAIGTNVNYTRVEGLELYGQNNILTVNSGSCSGSGTNVTFDDNLIQVQPASYAAGGIGIVSAAATNKFFVFNNIVFGTGGSYTGGIGGGMSNGGLVYAYNNTVYGLNQGFNNYGSGNNWVMKNNIAVNDTTDYANYTGWAPTSTNNISSDTSAPGSGALTNKTVTFLNSSAYNFLLSPSDTVALNAGIDLSADPNLAFNTDIAGLSRPQGTQWSIGASEVLANTSNETEMATLSFTSIYSAGFTATATFQGDANSNNSATIYYCDNTTSPGCNPTAGASAAMTRVAGSFSYSAANLINPTDVYNVEVVATDPDGVMNSPLTGTVTLLATPTKIYRSVGPGNTSALASGATNALTISGSTVTFASAVPNNVGVGDAVVYGSNADIAFISGRTSSTAYTLQSASGGTPTAISGDTTWAIYRAYTSVANAIAGTENTGIPAAVRSFETFSGGANNLVTPNYQWNIAVYGDATDTYNGVDLSLGGWTTSAANTLRIYSPFLSTEVGVTQRHGGFWQATGVATLNFPAGWGIRAGISNTTIEGLQIAVVQTSGSCSIDLAQANTTNITFLDNVLNGTGSSGSGADGVCVGPTGVAAPVMYIVNNIIYKFDDGISWSSSGSYTAYVYNNTIVNSLRYGIDNSWSGHVSIINNLVTGSGTADYSDSAPADYITATFNLSGDASSPDSTFSSKTVTYVNASGNDFRLSPADTSARDAGNDLSGDTHYAFNTDISNISRPQGAGWDIGASEATSSSSNATQILALSFSSVTSSGFTATATFEGDNNANNSATIYYCDNTTSPGCSPLAGSSVGMIRSAGQFTDSPSGLTNPGDVYNVEVVANDADGLSGSPLSGTVTLLNPPIPIYRSVGPANTSVLACGGGDGSGCANNAGNITISSTTATFASAIPNNVGVGDAIIYDCSGNGSLGAGDCVVFITSRASSTSYGIQSYTGGTASAYGPANVWRIYRSFTSLASTWCASENSAITAIDSTIGTEVNLIGCSANLVTSNEVVNFALYADAVDTGGQAFMNNVTTDLTHYVRFYTPYLSTEVGTSQRHGGTLGPGYEIRVTNNTAVGIVLNNYIIDGLQVVMVNPPSPSAGISAYGISSGSGQIDISNNIITVQGTQTSDLVRGIMGASQSGEKMRIWNNIIYNIDPSTSGSAGIESENTNSYIYNNTVYDCANGIGSTLSSGNFAKNNIVQADGSGGNGAYYGTWAAGSDYNISSDTTSPGGAHDKTSTTVAFASTANTDYLLSPTDTAALNAGEDLSADPNLAFNTDILSISRPQSTAWDIGASEALASSSNATEMLSLSFSTVYHTGFTATATFQGDANANNSATIYYCDNTSSPGCNPLSGTSATMTRASGTFTSYVTGLTNSGTDTYNVEVVASDADGVYGSPQSGTVTLLGVPTKIYRSVGPGNTSALASGAANALAISGSTATFASAIPNNVGVGDAVVYGSNADIAFISGRTSSTVYTLQSASGGTPTATSSDISWSIYRAYTSTENAFKGTSSTNGNSGIPSAVRGFDTFNNNNNLLTSNTQWNIAVYADAIDTNYVNINGWTTSPTNYLKIYAPYLSTDVGVSQRHSGVASGGAEMSVNGGLGFVIGVTDRYVEIDGLILNLTNPAATTYIIDSYNMSGGGELDVSNCLLSTSGTATGGTGLYTSPDSTVLTKAWNNIFYNIGVGSSGATAMYASSAGGFFYNNTIVNVGGYGIVSSSNPVIKNNIVQNATQGAFSLVCGSGSDYNVSSDTTSCGGAHDKTSKTVTFANSSGNDYLLSPSDTVALNAGEDLSADPNLAFNTDILTISRPQGTAWDIGASEVLASSSNATEMLALTFPSVFHSGFSATATFQGDANANNSATIYYCDATSTPGCNPLSGTSAPMTRSSGQFTYIVSGLTNSGTDTYNIEVVATDADGVYGSPQTGTVTLLTTPTQIYRSVGEGTTSALASGATNALTISGTTATFASAIPNNIGIGDAVVYGGSADIAFISARTSSTQYTLQSASGGSPTAISGDTSWAIYRAYSSLNNAIGQSYAATENTGIPAGVRNFDTWTGGDNLVAANQVWNIDLYADAPFDVTSINGITLNYWTESPDNYLNIYVPQYSTEVGTSQRHSGVWDSSKVYFTATVGSNLQEFYIWDSYYTRLDGLQMQVPDTGAGPNVAVWVTNAPVGNSDLRVSNSIVEIVNGNGGGGSTNEYGIMNEGGMLKVWNNIVFCTAGGTDYPDGIAANTGMGTFTYQYNNTVYGCAKGIQGGASYFTTKNNISCGNTTADYTGGTSGTHSNNISCDATSPDVAYQNKTVTFMNGAFHDYRLSPADASGAQNGGVNLSADPNIAFNTDIAGMSRPQGTGWDIGASEVLASTSNATEMMTLTFPNNDDNTFTAVATFRGDANRNSSAMIYYCDNTVSSGCNPLTSGTSARMEWATDEFTYAATGVTVGDTYNVDVVGNDPNGIYAPILTGTVTPEPSINISNITTAAGAPAQFVVTLSSPSSQAVTFNYATSDGTATQPTDYTSASGGATIAAGSTSVTLPNVTTQAAGAGNYFNMTLSSLANATAGTITATDSLIAAAAPPDVAGLQAVAQSNTRIDLSWNSGGGSTSGYEIAYQTGSSPANCSTGTLISSASINGDEYSVTGLTASTTYYFRVCAVNSDSLVSAGATISAATLASAPGTLPPPDVQNLEASGESTSEIDLAWTSGGGTTASFKIAYQSGTTAPTNCTSGTQLVTSSLTEPVTGLTGGTTYSFRVCAVDATGTYVSIGQTVTAATPSQNAITVSNLSATALSATSFTESIDFNGDTNNNSSATLYYCDNTNSPGCSPTSGTSVAMTRGAGQYTATVTGLTSPINDDDVLNIEVDVSDADGVTGSPLTTEVTLVAYKLVFTTEPSTSVTLGSALAQGPVVQVEDDLNHVITTGAIASGTIALSDTTKNGNLSGTTSLTAVDGAATFPNSSIQFEKGGSTSLTASETVSGYGTITGTSSTITATIPSFTQVAEFSGPNDPNGSVDGTGTTSARLWEPLGLASDGTYIYIKEGWPNCVIRRYTISGGAVSTFSGQLYNCGYTDGAVGTNTILGDGAGQAANQIVSDGSAYVYFTDGYAVRRMSTADGSITTIAGNATTYGSSNNTTGTSATFNWIGAIWLNGTTLYVADNGNCLIRAVDVGTSPYAVTTVAGSGTCGDVDNSTPTLAEVQNIDSFAADSTNLYFIDYSNGDVREMNWSTGAITTLQTGLDSSLCGGWHIYSVAVAGTTMYTSCQNIIKSATVGTWTWSTVAGAAWTRGEADGAAGTSRLSGYENQNKGVTLMASGTNVYFTDADNGALRVLDNTNTVTTLAGVPNSGNGWVQNATAANSRYERLQDLVSDGTSLYSIDYYNGLFPVISMSDGSSGTPMGSGWPIGSDSTQVLAYFGGKLYYANPCQIYQIDPSNNSITSLAGTGTCGEVEGNFATAQFNTITGIASDQNNLYVFDNSAIKKLDMSTDTVSVLSGSAGTIGCAVGTAANSRYNNNGNNSTPLTYLNGKLYFTQACDGDAIYQVDTSTGASSVVAGNGTYGYTDSALLSSQFGSSAYKNGLSMTTDGTYLYVYDYPNGAIRKIDIAGNAVTTLVGSSTQKWDVDSATLANARVCTSEPYIADMRAIYYGYGKLYLVQERGIRVIK